MEPLMLTPYIKKGRIALAQDLSHVPDLVDPDTRESFGHSGFLTVSDTNHLFFWFFPHRDPKAPLIIWLQGGPGESGMIGLFSEHGPYVIDRSTDNGRGDKLSRRPTAWTKNHAVLYIDSPVGAGFSFTTSEEGYARSLDDVSRDLHEALVQFFQLFPQYRTTDFYIAGESYGGKYVPALGRKIHLENQKAEDDLDKINLKGMAIGNAYSDPMSILDYGNFLYGVGLLGTNERKIFQEQEEKTKELICQGKFDEAFKVMDKLVFGSLPGNQPTTYEELTGLKTLYNFSIDEDPKSLLYFVDFVQKEEFRQTIHVGDRAFNHVDLGGPVLTGLFSDICQSTKPYIEELLNAPENYRLMFYTGQWDVCCAEPLIHSLVQNLEWKGAEDFKRARREIWRNKDNQGNTSTSTVAGYAQTSGNLTQVMVRNSGHRVPLDKPDDALDMITRFTRGQSFSST